MCFYEAYPPTSGAASVSYNMAKFARGDSFLFQLGRRDEEELTKDHVHVISFEVDSSSQIKKLCGVWQVLPRLVDAIHSLSPEVIVLEGASWAVYHWLLIRKLRDNFPNTRIMYHSHNVEYSLRRERHTRLVAEVTRWAERKVLQWSDVSFAVSEVDRRQFESLHGISPEVLPNGVDLDIFEEVKATEIFDRRVRYGLNDKSILFMGAYSYRPNREAIDFLVKSVMPKVLQSCPDAQIAIVGDEVPFKENWIVNPGCISYGDLPAFTCACRVGVAPIFSGSGTRLKILEYMAAGIPVVATSKGAEGLKVRGGHEILFAEGTEQFAFEIIRLLNDSQLCLSIGERGRKVIDAFYSWEIIMKDFNNALYGKCEV